MSGFGLDRGAPRTGPRRDRTRANAGVGDEVRVRMYAVGFGDAFLVLIPDQRAGRDRRVLVDCGSIKRGPWSMDEVVEAIIGDCSDDGRARIDVVVATHRHRDHIAGFASPRWSEVEVGEVWLPWTEAPRDADALGIRETQTRLARSLAVAGGLGDPDRCDVHSLNRHQVMALNATPNQNAMRTLLEGFANRPRRRFLPETQRFPEKLSSAALPGVSVAVLGPSHDEAVIRSLKPKKGESYLQLRMRREFGEELIESDTVEPFGSEWQIEEPEFWDRWNAPRAGSSPGGDGVPTAGELPDMADGSSQAPLPPLSQADRKHIEGLDDDNRALLALSLDHALNGTSLMLMLGIGDAHLLFPGDAQWGTWRRILADPASCRLLQRTTLLKVGHHGSHNATPRSFVEGHLPKNIRAMVSTCQVSQWPDIPRAPLLRELRKRGLHVARSDRNVRDPMFTKDPQGRYVETRLPMRAQPAPEVRTFH